MIVDVMVALAPDANMVAVAKTLERAGFIVMTSDGARESPLRDARGLGLRDGNDAVMGIDDVLNLIHGALPLKSVYAEIIHSFSVNGQYGRSARS